MTDPKLQPSGGLSRRRFLGTVVAPSVAALLGGPTACADDGSGGPSDDVGFDVHLDVGFDVGADIGDDVSPPEWDYPQLVEAYFGGVDMDGIRAIGRAYMRSFDGSDAIEDDLALLLAPLLRETALNDAVARCEEWVDGELSDAAVVVVAGWVISPTEARLCALAELA